MGYKEERIGVDYRDVARTPSPTPSEAETLANKTRTCNISSFKKYMHLSYFKEPKNLISFIITILVIGILIAFTVEQDNIAKALRPAGAWLRKTPGAWLIPIGIMVILSFPPLFGHELVALLCGEFWGLWIGFGIVAAGTILGELVTYYTFRYCCRARAQKVEEKDLKYALLTEVIRDGGLKMAIMVRYSAIPGHITTAIFATCGMEVWVFLVAAFASLPKQVAAVYLGTGTVDANGNMQLTKTQKIIKYAVITVTVLITILAMRYVNGKIDGVKQRVVYRRRKARQAKLGHSSASASAFASASTFSFRPARDEDVEDTAPLVPRSNDYARPSMDDAHVLSPQPSHAHAKQYDQGVPTFAPLRSSPPLKVYNPEARYDDAYGGRDAFATGGLRTPVQAPAPTPATSHSYSHSLSASPAPVPPGFGSQADRTV
ncbi:hypothetical protein V8D89_001817 [Ganoderma adspersum]